MAVRPPVCDFGAGALLVLLDDVNAGDDDAVHVGVVRAFVVTVFHATTHNALDFATLPKMVARDDFDGIASFDVHRSLPFRIHVSAVCQRACHRSGGAYRPRWLIATRHRGAVWHSTEQV